MLLVSASAGFAVASITGQPYLGLLLAMLAGGLMNLVMGYLTVTRRANQLASGLALALAASSTTPPGTYTTSTTASTNSGKLRTDVAVQTPKAAVKAPKKQALNSSTWGKRRVHSLSSRLVPMPIEPRLG